MNGRVVTDFILCVKKIIFREGYKYKFFVETKSGKAFEKVTNLQQVKRNCFLQDLPVLMKERDKFCELLYQSLAEKEFMEAGTEFQTGRNGLQKVGGRFMYVYTNGSIAADGFHSEVYSGEGRMIVPEIAVSENVAEISEKLFHEYNRNCNIFYPLFLNNIPSITNGFFRTIGEPELLSGLYKKDFITRSCVYSNITVVGKKDNIKRIVDALQEMQIVMTEIARQIQSGGLSLSDEGYQELKNDYLALVLTVVDIADGAAYLFDKKRTTDRRNWKAELELEQYRHVLERDEANKKPEGGNLGKS